MYEDANLFGTCISYSQCYDDDAELSDSLPEVSLTTSITISRPCSNYTHAVATADWQQRLNRCRKSDSLALALHTSILPRTYQYAAANPPENHISKSFLKTSLGSFGGKGSATAL